MPQNQQNSFKFDKGKMKKLLQEENDYIVDLLTTFDVPDSVEGECFGFRFSNMMESEDYFD